ncbi:MAG: hypothetical protein ACLT9P_09175 [Evtepia gabavorous]
MSSSAQGTLVNTAVVASSTPDPNPGSNTATSLVPVQGSTELRLTKPPLLGESLSMPGMPPGGRSARGSFPAEGRGEYRTICRARHLRRGLFPWRQDHHGGACEPALLRHPGARRNGFALLVAGVVTTPSAGEPLPTQR